MGESSADEDLDNVDLKIYPFCLVRHGFKKMSGKRRNLN